MREDWIPNEVVNYRGMERRASMTRKRRYGLVRHLLDSIGEGLGEIPNSSLPFGVVPCDPYVIPQSNILGGWSLCPRVMLFHSCAFSGATSGDPSERMCDHMTGTWTAGLLCVSDNALSVRRSEQISMCSLPMSRHMVSLLCEISGEPLGENSWCILCCTPDDCTREFVSQVLCIFFSSAIPVQSFVAQFLVVW